AERLAAQRVFLEKRRQIWEDIQEGRFPATRRRTTKNSLAPRGGRQSDVIFCWQARSLSALNTGRTAYLIWPNASCCSMCFATERSFQTEPGRSSTAVQSARRNCTNA